MPVLMPEPQNTLLGKETFYEDRYDPELLQAIPRSLGRKAIGDHNFRGTDIWRLYELSWLNPQGVPQTAWAELFVPATSPSIVESKSLKLYAGSYAMTPIGSAEEVARRFRQDVSSCLGADVVVQLHPAGRSAAQVRSMPGTLLDRLPIRDDNPINVFEPDPSLLQLVGSKSGNIRATWHTNAFRSLCPVTGQPDIASIAIAYEGRPVHEVSLLRYLVSYRRHRGFHEQCVEQIFHDLRAVFAPKLLEVYACFTRRGGIDINPFRSTVRAMPDEIIRETRQ